MEYYVLCFLALQIWHNNIVFGLKDCPSNCLCLKSLVSCTQITNISGVFDALPSWVEALDVSSNKLNDNFSCDLSNLDNLIDLKFSNNSFTRLPSVGYLQKLRKLSLSHNEIQLIDIESLQNFPTLENLNLNNNEIEKLINNSFPLNNSIKNLHFNSNRIKSIQKGAFHNLTNLVKLVLSKNRIFNIPKHLFQNQKHLKILEINENIIQKMDGLIFQGLDSLNVLKLRGNKIREMNDAVFFGLKNLTTLQLDRNSIRSISKGWMYGLNTMVSFSLTSNSVANFEQGCWEFSGLLQELDLSHNQLQGINGLSLQHLSSLRILKLDHNRISTIAENAFSHTPALEELHLSHNEISWTVEDMNGPFAKLNRLHTFYLAHNHIKSINNKAFLGLKMLAMLDLSGNNITSLQEYAFNATQNLKELRLNSGSLLCDCKMQWMEHLLNRLIRHDMLTASCAYPPHYKGQFLWNLLHMQRHNFTCDDSPKPRITEHPKTQLAIKGGTSRLRCEAVFSRYKEHQVDDHMIFLWRRNNANITKPTVKEMVSVRDEHTIVATSELSIPNITNSDSGKYQCVVSNSYGTTYSQKSKITIVIPPKFTMKPSNITVKVGDTVKLVCAAKGEPVPQIAWQKDGGTDFPAARERRMHIIPDDYCFFIINSNISDSGVYSCTAQNPAGAITSYATLTVLEAPSFVNAMINKEITAGDSVVLECMVSGSPKPSLNWLKDGAPIVKTERHFFTAEDQLLIIVGAVRSDDGVYECVITNTLGTVKDSTKLRVLSPVQSIVSDDDMLGIIIITVVCCAVFTSVIWVFFIYQTRKRMNNALPQFPTDSLQMAPLSIEGERFATHIFAADNISERSSCKDSGTGDSAKRSSLEVIPDQYDFPSIVQINHAPPSSLFGGDQPRISSPDENLSLLKEERQNTRYYYDGNAGAAAIDCVVDFSAIGRGDKCEEDSSRSFPYS